MTDRKKAPEFSYEGIFFDKEQVNDMLSGLRDAPLPDETKDYHITCNYRPDAFNADLVGHATEFKVVAYGHDGLTEGIRLEPCDHNSPEARMLAENEAPPHITLTIDRAKGARPVDCGHMAFDRPVPDGLVLRGRFGMFSHDLESPVTDPRDLPTPDRMPPVKGEQLRMDGLEETMTNPERLPRPDADRRRAVLVDVAIHKTRKPEVIRVSVPTRRAGSYVRADGERRALTGSIFIHESCVTPNRTQTGQETLGTVRLVGERSYPVHYTEPHPSGSIHADPIAKTHRMTGWQLRHENENYGRPADTRLERERTRQWQESLQPSLFRLEGDAITDERDAPQAPDMTHDAIRAEQTRTVMSI